MTIHVSWVDKRHVVLRSPAFENGASCHHFHTEAETDKSVMEYLARALSNGYVVTSAAHREWILTK